jgi:integrase
MCGSFFANLSAVLSAAVDDGLIAKNPCRAGSVKPPAPDRRRVQPWPGERVAAVREALPNRYAILVDMCAGLGLRQGEAFGLAVDDVDFLRSVVHVRRQVKILGSRQVFAPPKGGRIRDVPLPESVSLRLAAYLQAFGACEVMLPWQATGKAGGGAARADNAGEGGGEPELHQRVSYGSQHSSRPPSRQLVITECTCCATTSQARFSRTVSRSRR